MSVRGWFTARRQRALVRVMQVVIAAILLVGLAIGNGGVVVNALVGLLVTFVPSVLRRNYQFTMDLGLVLWITVAMFLHAVGTLPLPALDFLSPYKALWWWDHMTHALSSSLVAGVAYASTRALQEHGGYVTMPPRFLAAYLVLVVMAFGVAWELIEFLVDVSARIFDTGLVLTQYGLDDTVLDLVYNTVGGLLVAIFGTAHLTGLSDQLAERLDRRSAGR